MRLLLDTHAFLWMSGAPRVLGRAATDALADAVDIVFSTVVAWEIAIKNGTGRLDFPMGKLVATVASMKLSRLDITVQHALEAGSLPRHHADPFDRMLIAQARCEQLVLVTADRAFARYDVAIFPAR